jgi:hypothetical protein
MPSPFRPRSRLKKTKKSVDDSVVHIVGPFLHLSSGALADSSKPPSLSPPKKAHLSRTVCLQPIHQHHIVLHHLHPSPFGPTWTHRPRSRQHPNHHACQSFARRMRQPLALIFVGPFLCASWGGQVVQLHRPWRGCSCLPPISPRKCGALLPRVVYLLYLL